MKLSFTGSKGNLYVTVYLTDKDSIWSMRKYLDGIKTIPRIKKVEF